MFRGAQTHTQISVLPFSSAK
uniref:Uncharacterized protein n=1 Tax=Anopheles quadriannulatus TaxID=34691 RepID=A0A182XSI7_ANOQN